MTACRFCEGGACTERCCISDALPSQAPGGGPPIHDPGGKVRTKVDPAMRSNIWMSPCQRYRPRLDRWWDDGTGKRIMFIGMNPSTADAMFNDPTVSREIFFAKREGFGGIIKVNVMDVRLTNSKELGKLTFSVRSGICLPSIRQAAKEVARDGGIIIAAWGKLPPAFRVYADEALAAMREAGIPILCFGRNKDGSPKHPLYLRADTPLEPFND